MIIVQRCISQMGDHVLEVCHGNHQSRRRKKIDPARIQTWNPLIRSQMPYPLGHRANLVCIPPYFYCSEVDLTNLGGAIIKT